MKKKLQCVIHVQVFTIKYKFSASLLKKPVVLFASNMRKTTYILPTLVIIVPRICYWKHYKMFIHCPLNMYNRCIFSPNCLQLFTFISWMTLTNLSWCSRAYRPIVFETSFALVRCFPRYKIQCFVMLRTYPFQIPDAVSLVGCFPTTHLT